MRKEEDPQESAFLARLSLHRLGAYAIEEELIEGIEIGEHSVIIVQGENRFVLPPKQASTFLIGMLRGRSWFIEADEPSRVDMSEEPENGWEASESSSFHDSLEDALDSLLVFSREVGILEDFEKDDATQSVRIDISACSTTLSYADAMGYLLDCIQHELRTLREKK